MNAVKLGLRATALSLLAVVVACSSSGPVDESDLESADETAEVAEALTGSVPIGTTLYTTANLNLRSGPSTSHCIYHVIPKGAAVVTVNRSTPVNGWYDIKHSGTEGWSYGGYLTKSGGGGGGGSSERDRAIGRAQDGVGFSYWWGHGRWLSSGPSSSTKGSCSGSCPSCTHYGSYGADCSGFAAKVWVVPSSNDRLDVDSHPYSTWNFYNESTHWRTISRGNLLRGDAMVYNQNGAGHMYIYDHGDPWGSHWTYEARGCSYGIVHNVRTASSAYKAIRRDGW